MKEIPLSLCEKSSVVASIQSGIRLDSRALLELRPFQIIFGKDYGCCTVLLGETRVLAQVTCEVVEPRPSRPNEGKLTIAIHLSPMAASHFEQGRGNELIDELQQILDRNIKESRCLDVESLCIMAEESVWQFKVDVTVLNHAGNLGDACNLAAVAALRHFHRPDVTVEEDGRVTVHTNEERELIPTFMKKVPICLTYGIFIIDNLHSTTIMDPLDVEERVMSGKLVVGLNPHGEITSLLFPGKVCLKKNVIINCISNAFVKAKSIAEEVMKLVEDDLADRKALNCGGYVNTLKSDAEYCKKVLTDRIKGLRKMEIPTLKGNKNREEEEEDLMDFKETPTISDNEVRDEINDSSDEEFSPESLLKTLPEIKAAKNKTRHKVTKIKPENNQIDDEEIEQKTTKLNLTT